MLRTRRLLDHAHASVITVEKAAATLESGADYKDFVKHIKRGLIEFNQQLKGAEMSQTRSGCRRNRLSQFTVSMAE